MRLLRARRRLRLYGLILGAGFLVAALSYGLNGMFVRNMRESADINKLADEHLSTRGLYAGVVQSYGDFKHAEYSRVKPDIVAIGTSRATAFRADHFTRSFYNAAADDRDATNLLRIYRELSAVHKPPLVLFTVDYWNYVLNENDAGRRRASAPLDQPPPGVLARAEPPSANVAVIFRLVLDGTIGPRQYVAGALGMYPQQIYGIDLIGTTAIQRHFGILTDGSSFEYRKPALATRFAGAYQQIEPGYTGITQFPHHAQLDHEKVTALRSAVEFLRASGTRTVVIAPPLAPSVGERLRAQADEYAYIEAWREEMKHIVPNFFDVQDARELGAPDCEFVDGVHGGEVAYLRLLLKIAEAGNSPLADVTSRQFLLQQIERYHGKVVIAVDKGDRLFSALAREFYDPACDGQD